MNFAILFFFYFAFLDGKNSAKNAKSAKKTIQIVENMMRNLELLHICGNFVTK